MSADASITRGLAAVIDTLLPGDGVWPTAASLDIAPSVFDDVAGTPESRAGIASVLGALPPEFAESDQTARETVLATIERMHADAFERLVSAVYLAYYTHAAVRHVIEQRTGYEDRPPQPLGYALERFDEALLDRQKARAPFWRKI